MTARPILAVTGLAREAKLAAGPGIVTVVGGGSPSRLRALLAEQASACHAVLSFGIAGGLDPALAPGDVIVASGVTSADTYWPARPEIVGTWLEELDGAGERVRLGDLVGVEAPVLKELHKRVLRASTNGAAVDTESHIAAEFAAECGLPFAALRVICDPFDRALPPLTVEAVRPDGGVDLPAILLSLARYPAQFAALPRLARDAAAAFASLRRVRAALGPSLGLGGLSFGEPLGDVL